MRLVPSAVEGNPQPNAPSSRGSSVSADSRACVPQTTSDVLRSIQGERTASGGPARSLALVVNLHALRWIFGNADVKGIIRAAEDVAVAHSSALGFAQNVGSLGTRLYFDTFCPSTRPKCGLAQDKILQTKNFGGGGSWNIQGH